MAYRGIPTRSNSSMIMPTSITPTIMHIGIILIITLINAIPITTNIGTAVKTMMIPIKDKAAAEKFCCGFVIYNYYLFMSFKSSSRTGTAAKSAPVSSEK